MAAEALGHKRCPLCGGAARLSLMKSGTVILVMDCCKAQLMTRGGRADELARDLPDVPAPVKASRATAPAPTTASAPAAPVPVATKEKGVFEWRI